MFSGSTVCDRMAAQQRPLHQISGYCRAFCKPEEFSMKTSSKNGYVSLSEFY